MPVSQQALFTLDIWLHCLLGGFKDTHRQGNTGHDRASSDEPYDGERDILRSIGDRGFSGLYILDFCPEAKKIYGQGCCCGINIIKIPRSAI